LEKLEKSMDEEMVKGVTEAHKLAEEQRKDIETKNKLANK